MKPTYKSDVMVGYDGVIRSHRYRVMPVIQGFVILWERERAQNELRKEMKVMNATKRIFCGNLFYSHFLTSIQ